LSVAVPAGSGRTGLAAIAFTAGLAHAASFAPVGLWWLQSLSMAVLVVLAARHRAAATPGGAALAGGLFGFGWFVSGVSWLFISMHTYGGMPAPIAALSLAAFALYLAAFSAASLALASGALRRAADTAADRPVRRCLHAAPVFAAAWGAGELARGWLFTGFPWLSTGYAHTDGPLAGIAPIAGVHAVGMMAAVVAAGVGLATIAIADRALPGRATAGRGEGGGG
jgi:apolipoprotein N-acyltransferase